MREEFRSDLTQVGRTLVAMAEAVQVAMRHATGALLKADRTEAEQVCDRDAEIDALYRIVEDKVYDVIARQAPVASDLRVVLTALHVAGDLERMGDLAEHVAKAALRRHPAPAIGPELTSVVERMGEVADLLAGKIASALTNLDAVMAAQLERDDDEMDELYRQLFKIVLKADWPHGVESAVDAALLGRFYERYADHAVNIGQHVIFLVTGENAP
ncbi:phosphate signaling complex protein PhoU [Planosporangium flavigriseum]|uniref:Phosphate-specific transport system accessory protein PhoU n=1 Tax=Planosporangium flavigriseum TaxID=373681 RepID=A0A8J3LKR6_9ACTN|nr:phosphate signaling complex protein PhoU [Planosporangium flavigriseum]NJC63649.1 phosphate signaling complex protein PhoU [Planosporangium flavigriseum]GIG72350.1 phosphate transport system regulatory protein PhoU [Planosporangium flavigriseum]